MSDLSMFSKVEADRILKRAAELEGSDDPGPLTIDDLRSIASEAGFGAQAVERAIAEAQQMATASAYRYRVHGSGLVFRHLSTSRSVPVEITSDQLMQAVRLFQPYREGQAHVTLAPKAISWRDRKGLRFTVTSTGGVTEIDVYVGRAMLRRRRWTSWVQSAADRLETLILLMATRDLPRGARGRQARVPQGGTQAPRIEPAGTRS